MRTRSPWPMKGLRERIFEPLFISFLELGRETSFERRSYFSLEKCRSWIPRKRMISASARSSEEIGAWGEIVDAVMAGRWRL